VAANESFRRRTRVVTFFADLAIAGIPFDKLKDRAETGVCM